MDRIIAGCLAALLCAGAHAQVYKWVDANGVTHYDQKPPENSKSKEVQLHDAMPPAGNTAPAKGGDWQDKERAFKQRQTQRDKTAADQERDRKKKEDQTAQCAQRKSDLDAMRNSRRLFDTAANGERTYLDDDQRAARVAKNEAEYNQNCN